MHEIVNPSDLDVLQNAISEKQLVEKAEMPFLTFIEVKFKIWIQNRIIICFQVSLPNKTLSSFVSGQYGKQPIRTGDARGERAAEGRGETKQKLLIIFDVAECGFVPLNCICCACLFVV